VASFLQGTALFDGLARVDNDARGQIPARYANNLDRKFRHHQEPARSYAGRSELLDVLLDALLRERTLDVEYEKADGVRSFRGIRPLTLVVYRRALYLLAMDGESDTVRRMAVDWIRSAALGSAFEYPPGWNPDEELGSAFGFAANGEAEWVVLRFSAKVARYVTVRRWHPTATLSPLPDGRWELRMFTRGQELVRFCLEWGAQVEVMEPAWLRETVVRELENALKRYGVAASSTADQRVFRDMGPTPGGLR
jgi:predicted DNA-binding transcriptional regulator YafY